ncbi:hypothetical protein F4777DRAFT_545620 [Nemania sp. FL0916]|nr:hypothetical protein F4777DRAFT_545620 [Nemania sp. FL0916]
MSSQEAESSDLNAAQSRKEVISDLESRYIRLLQSKIAHLESQLENLETESRPAADDDDNHEEAAQSPVLGKANGAHLVRGQPTEPEQKESRYHMILSVWDPRTGEFRENSLPGIKNEMFGPANQLNRAFTFRKITGIRTSRLRSQDELSASEVDVAFPPLQRLLGHITSKWGWPSIVTKCSSPYSSLIYSWDEAQWEAIAIKDGESDETKQARNDLKELLRIISTSSGDVRLDRYFNNRQAFLSEGTITHDALWTLFPPGTLIVGRPCHDETQIFVVDSCDGFVSDEDTFEIICYSFDWNGFKFGKVPFSIGISGWGGDRKTITGLPFYPLRFYEEDGLAPDKSKERLEKELIERGKEYVKFCLAEKGKQMFNYVDGDAYFHRNGTFLKQKESKSDAVSNHQGSFSSTTSDHDEASTTGLGASWKPVEGAVIVDFASYLTYQSADTPILGSLQRYEGRLVELSPERRTKQAFKNIYKLDWDQHEPTMSMSAEQLLCCPPRVLGYALKRKTWVQLLVKHLKDNVEANAMTFHNELQLDDDSKDLISKSVMAHSTSRKREKGSSKRGLDDFAPEKGRGLVIMLYGQPGVGKTLTAESVAQMTNKPLLSVGVSDIGIEGDKVEMNLQNVFALAGLWEAVLLFDEADVFLESRGEGDNDLRRNAMVSVLLRVLEYYEGILILTTNRMRSLDIAVQSRIHLAIKFADLSANQKVNIFNSFLTQLSDKNLVENLKELETWVKKDGKRFDFNGRQIRNVISTALGIALADDRKLTKDDLTSVARQTDEFKRDLSSQEAVYRDRQINQRN